VSTSIVPSSDNGLSLQTFTADQAIDQATLIDQIRRDYRDADIFHRSAVVHWARCGAKLARLHQMHGNKRGGWQNFLQETFPEIPLVTARKMQQLAERYPELADSDRDYDQVVAEFTLEHPDLAPSFEKGINALLAHGTEPRRRAHPRVGPDGQAMAETLDGVEVEVRGVVDDPIGLLASQIPGNLARRLKEGEPEAFAQAFFQRYDANPPNPRQFSIFCEGALALREIEKVRATAERRGRAQRAGRARLSADEVLNTPSSSADGGD